jgi:hypothetical protein
VYAPSRQATLRRSRGLIPESAAKRDNERPAGTAAGGVVR